MTKHEAKLILSSYTLGNEPIEDASWQEAVSMTESDPELAAWWKSQKEEDRHIRDRLAESAVPSDLHSALRETLAGQERKRGGFARLRNWVAMAAAVALAGYVYLAFVVDRSDDYTGPLVERAYVYSKDGPRLSYFNRDTQSLRNWLMENDFDLPDNLPPRLLALEGIGCRPLDWSERRVAIMCFNAEEVYHLYIGYEQDFPNFKASEDIEYEERGSGWTISKWKQGEYVFVLNAKASIEALASKLASYTPEG